MNKKDMVILVKKIEDDLIKITKHHIEILDKNIGMEHSNSILFSALTTYMVRIINSCIMDNHFEDKIQLADQFNEIIKNTLRENNNKNINPDRELH